MQNIPTSEAAQSSADYTPRFRHWYKLALITAGLFLPLFVISLSVRFYGNDSPLYFAFTGKHLYNHYLMLHSTAEIANVIISFAVFTITWYTYRQSRNRRDLFIAVTFLLVGIIDFVHTFSYAGMPEFLSPSSPSKASTYWIFARLFAASGLLAAAFIQPASRQWWLRPRVLLPTALASAAALILVESYWHHLIPPMFIEGVGQTPIKIALEYVVMALSLGAVFAYERRLLHDGKDLELIQFALVATFFSELAFTQYSSVSDTYNLIGHIYKILAYYFILRALFVSSVRRPYDELAEARKELQRSFTLIGEALATSASTDEVLRMVLQFSAESLHCSKAFIALESDEDPNSLEVVAKLGIQVPVPKLQLNDSNAGMAKQSGSPLWVSSLDEYPYSNRHLLEQESIQSMLSVPIIRGEKPVGVLEVFSERPNAFGKQEAELLFAFARQAGVALENAGLFEKSTHIAETFQKSLLPKKEEYPVIDGIEIDSCYRAAWKEAEVGGDFFDVFLLPDGKLGFVMADVSGKGLNAAVYTAMAKYMLHAYAMEHDSPAEVMTHLNNIISNRLENADFPFSYFITLFYATLDPATGSMRYANAGHEPPLHVNSRNEAEPLDSTGTPLGIMSGQDYGENGITLTPGDALVLYTDGITDLKTDDMSFLGQDGLAELLSGLWGKSAEEIHHAIHEPVGTLTEKYGQRDDIALLIVRWTGQHTAQKQSRDEKTTEQGGFCSAVFRE